MKKQFSALLIATFLTLNASAALLINSGEDFKATLRDWESLDYIERLERWVAFEKKYKSTYDFVVWRKHEGGWETRQEVRRNEFFYLLPALKDSMIQIFESAPEVLAEAEKEVHQLEGDLPENVPVYLVPSMMGFESVVEFSNEHGREAVYVGVDQIAQNKSELKAQFVKALSLLFRSNR